MGEMESPGAIEGTFEIEPAPRRVPLGLRARLWFGSGLSAPLGWFVWLLGVVLWRLVIMNCTVLDYVEFTGEKARTSADLLEIAETDVDMTAGQPIWRFHYRYQVGGVTYTGDSYGTTNAFRAGTEVVVEYLRDEPGNSRIQGLRRYLLPKYFGWLAIFPLLGLWILWFSWHQGARRVRVLRRGRPALGRPAVYQSPSGRPIAPRGIELAFGFQDHEGETRGGQISLLEMGKPLIAMHGVRLLYGEKSNGRIELIDALPGSAGLDSNHRLSAPTSWVLFFLIPLVGALLSWTILTW